VVDTSKGRSREYGWRCLGGEICVCLMAVFHPKYYVHALILLPVEMHVLSEHLHRRALARYVTLPNYFSHPSFSY